MRQFLSCWMIWGFLRKIFDLTISVDKEFKSRFGGIFLFMGFSFSTNSSTTI
jgi:hypothetical protein